MCEPQLGKRGLYPTISTKSSGLKVAKMMDLLAYCDGKEDIIAVAKRIGAEPDACVSMARELVLHNLLEIVA